MRKGVPWGEPLGDDRRPDAIDVSGGDADLAAAVAAHPDATFRFVPDATSDFARALGLTGLASSPGTTAVVCDAIGLPDGSLAVNAVVFGTAPDRLRWWNRHHPLRVEVDGRVVGEGRATSVVVASGQFLRGGDIVPRGHPGDGRVEVQVYDLNPAERRAMRTRLPRGAHVPHPRISERTGRTISVHWTGRRGRSGARWEADGRVRGRVGELRLEVRSGAVRVLV